MLSPQLDTQSSYGTAVYSENHNPYNYKHLLNPSQTYSQERGRSTCDNHHHGIFEANVKSTPPCLPHDLFNRPGLPPYCDEIPTAFQRAWPTNQIVRPQYRYKEDIFGEVFDHLSSFCILYPVLGMFNIFSASIRGFLYPLSRIIR